MLSALSQSPPALSLGLLCAQKESPKNTSKSWKLSSLSGQCVHSKCYSPRPGWPCSIRERGKFSSVKHHVFTCSPNLGYPEKYPSFIKFSSVKHHVFTCSQNLGYPEKYPSFILEIGFWKSGKSIKKICSRDKSKEKNHTIL